MVVKFRSVARPFFFLENDRPYRRGFLDLKKRVHDVRGGRPSGVAISTAATGDGDVDREFTWVKTSALAHHCGRIVVVVAAISVHGSRNRHWARTAVDQDFPTTPLATSNDAQVVVVKDSHYPVFFWFLFF